MTRLRRLRLHEKALVACIKDKWEPLAAGSKPVNRGCALCEFIQSLNLSCDSCPLKAHLGDYCGPLGYGKWYGPSCVAAAKVMLGNLQKCLRKVRAAIKKEEAK